MKSLALSLALLTPASAAMAEVTLSGDARMGLVNGYDAAQGDTVTQFSSRARLKFTLSGETDSGLGFGATFRADQAGAAVGNTAMAGGTVLISGAFGTLTMGDNDSAAKTVIGNVDGVGYTGNGDLNELSFLGQTDTSALFSYAAGGVTLAASLGQTDAETDFDGNARQAYALAAAYAAGPLRLAAGYESGSAYAFSYTEKSRAYDPGATLLSGPYTWYDGYNLLDQVLLGADASFGDLTVRARLTQGSGVVNFDTATFDATQYALSASYRIDALSLTAFAARFDVTSDEYDYWVRTTRMGLGAAYDLGGGAVASVGYSTLSHDLTGPLNAGQPGWEDQRWEAGLTLSF